MSVVSPSGSGGTAHLCGLLRKPGSSDQSWSAVSSELLRLQGEPFAFLCQGTLAYSTLRHHYHLPLRLERGAGNSINQCHKALFL